MKVPGPSLAVQWLRLRAPNAGCLGLIPGQGTVLMFKLVIEKAEEPEI